MSISTAVASLDSVVEEADRRKRAKRGKRAWCRLKTWGVSRSLPCLRGNHRRQRGRRHRGKATLTLKLVARTTMKAWGVSMRWGRARFAQSARSNRGRLRRSYRIALFFEFISMNVRDEYYTGTLIYFVHEKRNELRVSFYFLLKIYWAGMTLSKRLVLPEEFLIRLNMTK